MLLESPPFALRAALENKLTIDCSVNAVVASLPEAPPFKSIEMVIAYAPACEGVQFTAMKCP